MTICDSLGAFCDGELTVGDADAFRAHLGDCEACQRGLEDWMQIQAHASDAMPRVEMKRPSWLRRAWRWLTW